MLSGLAQSTDPDYIGLSGSPVNVLNSDNRDGLGTTNNRDVHICDIRVVSSRRVGVLLWEYVLGVSLTNTGIALGGVEVALTEMPVGMNARVDNRLTFGAVGQSETTLSTTDTVTVRSIRPVGANRFQRGTGFRWTVTTRP